MMLNQKQQEAVEYYDVPQLVLAGAGSGKTRVIINKIAHLISKHDIKPYNILAVTFTNKAADEMRSRADNMIEGDISGLKIATFHSICLQIMRCSIDRLKLKKEFIIYDTNDQLALTKHCIKSLDISSDMYNHKAILHSISGLKNRLITPGAYLATTTTAKGFDKAVARVYEKYQKALVDANAIDFDDIIMETVFLFRENDDLLAHYENRYKYLMVDEYQDINIAQYELIHLLTRNNRNICVVGDDDQSIYGFRGADSNIFKRFELDFPEMKLTKLEQNYRSTKTILKAANSVVGNNHLRTSKELWTENTEGDLITCYKASNDLKEATFVKNRIKTKLKSGERKNSDFAILYRINSQSRVIEDSLRQSGIKYRVVGGHKFYDRKEVKDLICYLRFMHNPNDDTSLLRIINTPPRGIGQSTVAKLLEYADNNEQSLYNSLLEMEKLESVSPRIKNNIGTFIGLHEKLSNFYKSSGSGSKLVNEVVEVTDYTTYVKEHKKEESASRIDNIHELVSALEDFEELNPDLGLQDFLDSIALYSDEEDADNNDLVTLMTLHSAKGLEFSEVFLVGVEQGLLPHFRSEESPEALEEERRLCYVGITRAREKLHLSYAVDRRIFGAAKKMKPSIFINEMPEELKDEQSDKVGKFVIPNHFNRSGRQGIIKRTSSAAKKKETILTASKPLYSKGEYVIHNHWGGGFVMDSFGAGEALKVVVDFKSVGKKMLAMKYTSLERSSATVVQE